MRQFDDLYATRAGYVYALCYRLEGEGEKAEQLFADVWKRVHETLSQPESEGLEEPVLLCRQLAHSHRHLGRTAGALAGSAELALTGLAPEYRLPLVLREVGGLSYAAIAQALDIPQATVRARLGRARAMVRGRQENPS